MQWNFISNCEHHRIQTKRILFKNTFSRGAFFCWRRWWWNPSKNQFLINFQLIPDHQLWSTTKKKYFECKWQHEVLWCFCVTPARFHGKKNSLFLFNLFVFHMCSQICVAFRIQIFNSVWCRTFELFFWWINGVWSKAKHDQ